MAMGSLDMTTVNFIPGLLTGREQTFGESEQGILKHGCSDEEEDDKRDDPPPSFSL